MLNELASRRRYAYGIIVRGTSNYWTASLKSEAAMRDLVPDGMPSEVRELDVVVLHSYILGKILGISAEAQEKKLNIHYIQTVAECEREVMDGTAQIAFIVNPTRIEQVRAVAKAGHTMPQKSTFFYPKLLSGLVFNKMAE